MTNPVFYSLTIGAPCLISILATWLITRCYYRKSIVNQTNEASQQIEELVNSLSSIDDTNKDLLMQKKIEDCLKEYKKAGTPIRIIDTYDLTIQEKAELLDKVVLRVKGRKAKVNKYRKRQIK